MQATNTLTQTSGAESVSDASVSSEDRFPKGNIKGSGVQAIFPAALSLCEEAYFLGGFFVVGFLLPHGILHLLCQYLVS